MESETNQIGEFLEASSFYQRALFAALDGLIGFDVGFW
jgi:hypothetical protein